MTVAMNTFFKVLIGAAVLTAQQLDINATQHALRPPYNGHEQAFYAQPWVHENGYAEQWAATLASDVIQYELTKRWSDPEQAAAWMARAGAQVNASLQTNASIRRYNATVAQPGTTR